jgi:hypothetical protein
VLAGASGVPASAGERIRPDSIGFKRAVYHAATGVLEPVDGGAQERLGHVIWRSTQFSGYFAGLGSCGRPGETDEMFFDWGDLPGPASINGFELAYATDASEGPNAIELALQFYSNSNGFAENQWPPVAGFWLALPGKPAGYEYPFFGWFVTVDLEGSGLEFTLGDEDLDGDGFRDFGYSYHALRYGDSTATGPLISEPNDPLSGPGAEGAFDLYIRDPNAANPCDPNTPFNYDGTYWFDWPFPQFHLALYSGSPCVPTDCSQSNCGCADFNADGRVNIGDLSRLLSAFGAYPGVPRYDPAVDNDCPLGVGLEDLSALLSVYGLECE